MSDHHDEAQEQVALALCMCPHHSRMHTAAGCQAARIERGTGWIVGCDCKGEKNR